MLLLHVSLTALLAQFALVSPTPLIENAIVLETHFSYTAKVPSTPDGSKALEIWLPIPSNNAFQTVSNLQVDSPVDHLVTRDQKFGNRMIYVFVPEPVGETSITVSFDVHRTEATRTENPEPMSLSPDSFLKPDRLVPIDGRYYDIAKEVAGQRIDSFEKTQAFYQHVLDTMEYDYKKESPKLGEGDVAFVCDYKRGNCSDLHSYLISLSRAMGVPAYLEFGFPITGVPVADPLAKSGKIGGYHCWTWVYVDGAWLPLDASDAKKWLDLGRKPEVEHLLGNLILERSAVAVSRGRDIVLEPAQHGSPLNNFIYPYAEADGRSVEAEWELTYEVLNASSVPSVHTAKK